jgi:hypothetical protein
LPKPVGMMGGDRAGIVEELADKFGREPGGGVRSPSGLDYSNRMRTTVNGGERHGERSAYHNLLFMLSFSVAVNGVNGVNGFGRNVWRALTRADGERLAVNVHFHHVHRFQP